LKDRICVCWLYELEERDGEKHRKVVGNYLSSTEFVEGNTMRLFAFCGNFLYTCNVRDKEGSKKGEK